MSKQETLNACIKKFTDKFERYPLIVQTLDDKTHLIKTVICLGSTDTPISFGYASISTYTNVNDVACESAINAFKNFDSNL